MTHREIYYILTVVTFLLGMLLFPVYEEDIYYGYGLLSLLNLLNTIAGVQLGCELSKARK